MASRLVAVLLGVVTLTRLEVNPSELTLSNESSEVTVKTCSKEPTSRDSSEPEVMGLAELVSTTEVVSVKVSVLPCAVPTVALSMVSPELLSTIGVVIMEPSVVVVPIAKLVVVVSAVVVSICEALSST